MPENANSDNQITLAKRDLELSISAFIFPEHFLCFILVKIFRLVKVTMFLLSDKILTDENDCNSFYIIEQSYLRSYITTGLTY